MESLKGWIARDGNNNSLWFFENKPVCDNGYWSGSGLLFDGNMLGSLLRTKVFKTSFKNSPQKCTITIEVGE